LSFPTRRSSDLGDHATRHAQILVAATVAAHKSGLPSESGQLINHGYRIHRVTRSADVLHCPAWIGRGQLPEPLERHFEVALELERIEAVIERVELGSLRRR